MAIDYVRKLDWWHKDLNRLKELILERHLLLQQNEKKIKKLIDIIAHNE